MNKQIFSFGGGAAIVALVVAVLLGAGVLDTGSDSDTDGREARSPLPASNAASARPVQSGGGSVADIYARVSPGVAYVTTSTRAQPTSPFGGDERAQASGSGFLIDRDEGWIVTNQHVVDDSDAVRVQFSEKGKPVEAKVVGIDRSTDIALLKAQSAIPDNVPELELGNSHDLRPGDGTIAIGAPFGLAGTVTTGIVSALNRNVTSPNGFPIDGVIQTDAAINPGNSGGPLLDAGGKVIGINSQIEAGSGQTNSGVGFAVPVDTLEKVLPTLEKGGEIKRAYLGISSSEVPPAAASQLGRDSGAVVASVPGDGPAADAGLRQNDLIVEIDGKAVNNPGDVSNIVESKQPGDEVTIKVLRNRKEQTVKVKLGERPDQAQQQQQRPRGGDDDEGPGGGLIP